MTEPRPRDKKKNWPTLVAAFAVFLCAGVASAAGEHVKGSQVSVGTSTAVEIGTHDAARIAVTWYDSDAANPIYCDGVSTVTSSTGMKFGNTAGLQPGMSVNSCQGVQCGANYAIYCIATGGTVTVQ